jgi:hypothetical protein
MKQTIELQQVQATHDYCLRRIPADLWQELRVKMAREGLPDVREAMLTALEEWTNTNA